MPSHNDVKSLTNFASIHLILKHPTSRWNCKVIFSPLFIGRNCEGKKSQHYLQCYKALHLKAVIFLLFPFSPPYTLISVESLMDTGTYMDMYKAVRKKSAAFCSLHSNASLGNQIANSLEEIFFTAPGKQTHHCTKQQHKECLKLGLSPLPIKQKCHNS